jgi:hypothetical protein
MVPVGDQTILLFEHVHNSSSSFRFNKKTATLFFIYGNAGIAVVFTVTLMLH